MQQSGHVAIAGGGIIGLACAMALRRRGLQVTVVEAGEAMREASWAAGGMLAVHDPENPPALRPLSIYSRSLYSSFLEEIERLSGLSVPLRTQETVQVRGTASERSEWMSLSREEAKRLIPGLGDADHAYVLLEEASLDPRDLCTALPRAARGAGVSLRENERVLSIDVTDDELRITTSREVLRADAFVNCCGAWAGSIDASLEIAPRKGQMLVVAQPKGMRLTRVLRSPEIYLIPRGDDRIVIGATVEDMGYSKTVEPVALAKLRERAAALWPPAADAPLTGSWAGLRPSSADALPTIGRCQRSVVTRTHSSVDRRFIATGHYRNGILLAPGTAEAIADLVCGLTAAVDLAAFSPHRPSLAAVCDNHFAAAL
jgi:glycine oxidase